MILIVIIYQSIYNIVGCYPAAKLAPNRSIRHAMILWIIGFALSILATIANGDIPPHFSRVDGDNILPKKIIARLNTKDYQCEVLI